MHIVLVLLQTILCDYNHLIGSAVIAVAIEYLRLHQERIRALVLVRTLLLELESEYYISKK